MGVLHNELETTNLGRTIRAALGIKEGDKTIERFGETITPVIDLYSDPSWNHLRGEEWCAGFSDQAAGGAGNITEINLRNQTGSNTIVQLKKLYVVHLTGTTLQIKVGVDTDLGTKQNTTAFLDTRVGASSTTRQPITEISTKNGDNTTHGFEFMRMNGSVGTVFQTFDFPMILSPGFALYLAVTANTAMEAGFLWTERRALAGELP